MSWTWSAPAVAMLLSGALCVLGALHLRGRAGAVSASGLAAALAGAGLWGLAYGLELGVGGEAAKTLWGSLKYVGVCVVPVAWLAFALQYTGRERLVTRRLVGLLSIVPAVVLLALAIPATRGLVRAYPEGPLERFPVVELGPLFWVLLLYATGVALVATGILALTLVRTSAAYRGQAALLLAAIALVLVANLLTNLGVGVFAQVDPTPVALCLAGLLVILGVFRFGLLELVPVARTALVETLPDAVLVLDAHHRVVDLNPAAARVFEPRARAAVGAPVHSLLGGEPPWDSRGEGSRHELALGEGEAAREYELAVSPLGDQRHPDAGHLLVLRDITERKQAERRLEQLAHSDAVTGLATRRLFEDRLDQAIERARRHGGVVGVLFFDLDRFKVVNDSLGHDAGDRLLATIAERVRLVLRREDTLARFGGDEFCAVLAELAHPQDAALVAAKVREAVARPIRLDGHEVTTTTSVGIAVFPQDGEQRHALVLRADAGMYLAKRGGGNRVAFGSEELARESSARLELESELRGAVERGELLLDFQPFVDLRSGGSLGFEALVRWRHPRRGVLAPAEFLPVAEDIGLIEAIDAWVLEEACRQAPALAGDDTPAGVAVNLSPARLFAPGLADAVSGAVEASGLPPERLLLEISERTVLEEQARGLLGELRDLKALGVSLALDDFGAGCTSLSQLRELPVDVLKVDRAFVARMHDDEGSAAIVAAIVALAHTLGMSVVAEGVEQPAQVARLRDLGCDAGQGFLFSRPRSAAALRR